MVTVTAVVFGLNMVMYSWKLLPTLPSAKYQVVLAACCGLAAASASARPGAGLSVWAEAVEPGESPDSRKLPRTIRLTKRKALHLRCQSFKERFFLFITVPSFGEYADKRYLFPKAYDAEITNLSKSLTISSQSDQEMTRAVRNATMARFE